MSKRTLTVIALLEAAVIVVLVLAVVAKDVSPDDAPPIELRDAVTDAAVGPRVEPAVPAAEPRLKGVTDAVPAATPASPWTLAPGDPLRIVVYGSAITADGEVVEKPAIWLRSPDGTYATASTTGGAFVFVGIQPGRYNLSCRAEGFAPPQPRDVVLDAGESSRREDLVFTKTTQILVRAQTPAGDSLKAKAVEAHVPVDQWAVVATHVVPSGNLPLTTLRNHDAYGLGKWIPNSRLHGRGTAIPKGYLGRVDVKVAPPFFLSLAWRHVVLETVEVGEMVKDITFEVPLDDLLRQRAPVRLKVVDAETDEPLADISVDLSDQQSRSFGLKTDESGVYEAEHHPPGLLQLSVGGGGYAGHWQVIRLEGGRLNDLGTVRLHKPRRIHGRVVDGRGTPVQGSLTWRDPALMTFPQQLHPNWSAQTDEKGAFVLSAGPVDGLLLFSARGMPPVTVRVPPGAFDVQDLEVVVPEGVLVRIQPQGEQGWHHVFALETAEGLPLLSQTVRGPWPIARHLAPGRYVLRVHAPDGTESRTPILVGEEELDVPVER